MRSNLRMQKLLARLQLDPNQLVNAPSKEVLALEQIDGCVFLAQEYVHSKGARLDQFPDRTGFECFVNHVHFRVGSGRQVIERVFSYISTLRRTLASLNEGPFEIIMSVSDAECTVRFHKCRPGESWLSADLEGYESEAILSVTV